MSLKAKIPSKKRLLDLAYVGYLAVFCMAALFSGLVLLGRVNLVGKDAYFLLVFPLLLFFVWPPVLLLGLGGFVAACIVVRHDWRPLALWASLWPVGAGLIDLLEGFPRSPFITAVEILLWGLYVASSSYFAGRWFGKKRKQFS